MNREQAQFLELLRAGLWGSTLNSDNFRSENTFWPTIYQIACEQAVPILVSDGIETLPKEFWPPKDVIYKFAIMRIKTSRMHKLLNSTLGQIVKVLESKGVYSVILKGQGVAQNYLNPESRACGDIDLYTGLGGYKKAYEIIETMQSKKAHNEAKECTHHMHTSLNGVEVEIHRQASIVHGKRLDAKFQEWTRQSIDSMFGTGLLASWDNSGIRVSLPPPTFNAFFILHHAVRHMTIEGVGFRQLCDWTMVLHKYHSQIDSELLKKKLKEQHMELIWSEFGRLAVNYLGLPKEELPLAPDDIAPTDRTMKLLNHIFISGNFGRYDTNGMDRSKTSYLVFKWRSMSYQTKRLIKLFQVFPRYSIVYFWHWYTGAIVRFITQTDK